MNARLEFPPAPTIDTETLDVTKLTWSRPLHMHETFTHVTVTPWKALCGAILYDIIPEAEFANHKRCEECALLYLSFPRENS